MGSKNTHLVGEACTTRAHPPEDNPSFGVPLHILNSSLSDLPSVDIFSQYGLSTSLNFAFHLAEVFNFNEVDYFFHELCLWCCI